MRLPKDMDSEEKNWFGLIDILISVSAYQNKYNNNISVQQLLTQLKKTDQLDTELDLGWAGSHQCRMYIIYTFCKRNNLFFNEKDEITRDTPKYLVNSREEIWDKCTELNILFE